MESKSREEEDRQIKIWHSLPEETKKEITKLKNRGKRNPKSEQEARDGLQEFGFLMDNLPRHVSYEAARQYAISLGLKGHEEWRERTKTANRPDIPIAPDHVYRDKSWTSWGDFLGTGTIDFRKRSWKSFAEAQEFAHSLGIKSSKEWRIQSKLGSWPNDIPIAPEQLYCDKGWKGWGDFLGTGNVVAKDFVSFAEAQEFVQNLGLKSSTEWLAWRKSSSRPEDIPSAPDQVYRDKGWKGWGDFLGMRQWKSFTEAREFVQSLGLRSIAEWETWRISGKRPDDIPASPYHAYQDKGWTSWGDFLGTNNTATRDRRFRPFLRARTFARRLELTNSREWIAWALNNRPDDIPSAPNNVYRDKGWVSWGDFLGNRQWKSFTEAREFVQNLGLKSTTEWLVWRKSSSRPDDIPSAPDQVYRDKDWTSWGDFLGTGTTTRGKRLWRSFAEAREFARGLGLRKVKEWQAWCKYDNRPVDIPSAPDKAYCDKGWKGWGDFLGAR